MLENDLQLKTIMNRHEKEVYEHGCLDMFQREMVAIACICATGSLKPLCRHVERALEIMCPQIIKEIIYQTTPYIGLGKVEEALDICHDVFFNRGMKECVDYSTVNEETRFDLGLDVQCRAFSKEAILSLHEHAPEELKHIQNWLSAHCFGDFYTRQGLTLAQREMITFVSIAALGGCESQLRSHCQANMKVGNTRNQLIDAISQVQMYIGFPRTLNALNVINEVTQ